MFVRSIHNGKKMIYQVCNSKEETGERIADTIACFDTLESAAVVLRYLQGCTMDKAEKVTALEALKKAAATTNHSADSRQKG